jgi:D-alanyl-D-alanine carboxypeptidase/D-alanyl-D-alanine-endopeptidase (penicillin-binding protein 4)
VIRAAIALAAWLVLCSCGAPRTVDVTPAAPARPAAPADRLRTDLAAIFTAPQFDRSFWSVLVQAPGSAEPLFALNASKLMMPGSAMKIVTAAAAAELLGWDHQFETRIVTTVPVDSGVLRGDLVVVGGGDPSISERSDMPGTMRTIARQVRDAGITRIEGGVIGDDDLFDDRGVGDGWTLDNLPYGYSAPISALEYNEGSIDLLIRAGAEAGTPVAIQVRPDGSGIQVDNQLVTAATSASGALTLQRNPGSPQVLVRGQIPAKAASFARTASVDNPTRFFVSALRSALIGEGVQVAGDAVDIDELETKPDLAAARTLVSYKSPTLRQLISSMMKVSQNQYAEMLLRHLGTMAGPAATSAMGVKQVRDLLQRWKISEDSLVMADGSGLSRYNYVTSDALVRILTTMRGEERHASAFIGSLAIAGGDGTLAGRLAGTPAAGKVRAKTGTVDNARAIAGYVETPDGDTLVFSMIANNYTAANSVVDAAADDALIRLAAFTTR